MNIKQLGLVLTTSALVALGGTAMAQDKSGQNVSKDTAKGEPVVETLATAQKLYQEGNAADDALLVAAAAKLMMSVETKDTERQVTQAAIEGAATNEEEGADAPVGADAMLARAKELATGDDAMLAMIDDIEAEGGRGRIGGPTRTLSRLPAGYYDTWEIPYYGGSMAELAVNGDGDADLDLIVSDENGNTICYDTSYSDQLYCSWTPLWDGYFVVTVKNMGGIRNSYYLLTN
jgi:hypothetical protein